MVGESNPNVLADADEACCTGEKLCGVGITFVEDSNGALYVKSLVPNGSAAQSQQILVV